jgi:hypothetical protein
MDDTIHPDLLPNQVVKAVLAHALEHGGPIGF